MSLSFELLVVFVVVGKACKVRLSLELLVLKSMQDHLLFFLVLLQDISIPSYLLYYVES